MAALIPRRIPSDDPAADSRFEMAANWIQTCVKTHPLCQQEFETSLPTRLIDVGESDGSQTLRIIHKSMYQSYG